jgi:hypothetical protein
MIRQCFALFLIGAMLGVCSPVFAGDYVSQRFAMPVKTSGLHSSLPMFGAKAGFPASYAAFGLPESGQQQSGQPAPAPKTGRNLSTKGKVLTIIGIATAASGAIMMAQKDQTISSSCSGNTCTSISINWKATGGITVGIGAVLAIIGLTRRE